MPSRKSNRGGSSLLTRINRISTVGVVANVGLCLVLCAIVERAWLTTFGPPGPASAASQGAAVASEPARSSRASREVRPAARLTALDSTVRQLTLVQRGAQARRTFGTRTTGQPIVQQSRTTKTWAFGTSALPPPKGSPAMPDVSLFLAHASGARWEVAFAGTSAFSTLLRTAPAAVMSGPERSLLARYSAATTAKFKTGLMLPWTQGESWSLVADKYGVGFTGGDGQVLAAGDGRLYRFCGSSTGRGLILLIHPDGLATEYYQLTSGTRLADGSQVKRGDYLGNVGVDHPCGGGTSEPQVRFGLRHADQELAIDGWTIGGWTFHAGTGTDSFVAVRDDLQALPGEPVVNLGVPRVPGIVPIPSIDPELPLPSLKPNKPAKSK